MLFASSIQIIGVGVFGYILSNVASLISRMDAAREHHMNNVDRTELFMNSHDVPQNLRGKIRSYYHYLWTQHRGYQDRSTLKGLPGKLQSDLLFFINRSIIERIPFLKGSSQELLEELVHELVPRIYVPGETIFRAGDPGDAIYFIHSGEIAILTKDGTVLTQLHAGDYFGEMALISNEPRNATARAAAYSDLYQLPKAAFLKILQTHPECQAQIDQVMMKRRSA